MPLSWCPTSVPLLLIPLMYLEIFSLPMFLPLASTLYPPICENSTLFIFQASFSINLSVILPFSDKTNGASFHDPIVLYLFSATPAIYNLSQYISVRRPLLILNKKARQMCMWQNSGLYKHKVKLLMLYFPYQPDQKEKKKERKKCRWLERPFSWLLMSLAGLAFGWLQLRTPVILFACHVCRCTLASFQ